MRINVDHLEDPDKDDEDDSNLKYNNLYLRRNNIKKVINYDDKRVRFTERQEKIDAIVNSHINTADNIIVNNSTDSVLFLYYIYF